MKNRLIKCICVILFLYGCFEIFSLYTLYFCHEKHTWDKSRQHSTKLKDYKKRIIEIRDDQSEQYMISKKLGWTLRQNSNRKFVTTNQHGIRSDHDFLFQPPENKIRIATFGDQYTLCNKVTREYSWQEQIYNYDPNWELLNFGVKSYGLDQAYLRYKHEGSAFNAHIVMLCLTPKDIALTVSLFLPCYNRKTNIPLFKPRYIVENDMLRLISPQGFTGNEYQIYFNSPKTVLSLLDKYDNFYKINSRRGLNFLPSYRLHRISRESKPVFDRDGEFNADSEAFNIVTKIIEEFTETALKNNSLPVIALLPEQRSDIDRYLKREYKFDSLRKFMRIRKYHFIDLDNIFPLFERQILEVQNPILGSTKKKLGKNPRALPRYHHHLLANEIFAKYMVYYFESNNLHNQSAISSMIRNGNKSVAADLSLFTHEKQWLVMPDMEIEVENGFIMNSHDSNLLPYRYNHAQHYSPADDPESSYIGHGNIVFTFDIKKSGLYKLAAKVLIKSRDKNSIYVKMSQNPCNLWHLPITKSPKWKTSKFGWHLRKGKHTMIIGYREMTYLDKIKLIPL